MPEVIGVRFRGGVKEYYFDPRGTRVEPGQFVIVETAQGTEYAQCVSGNREVEDKAIVSPLRAMVRIATANDRSTFAYNKAREKDAFGIAQKRIAAHGLDMKLVRVESNFDGSKIVFYFTSDGRVDFRELVRDLASVFHSRIELRQIGVRDEAKMLGGIGICGRPFCCEEFLTDFIPVSIKMAKTQSLSLNPTKISGSCGRLMCCLKYEQDAYEDAVKRCPRQESFVLTPDGPGNVSAVDLLRERVTVRLDDAPESPKHYRTAEIRVLRNGKGSREGIEIPRERPARWVDPDAGPDLSLFGSNDPTSDTFEPDRESDTAGARGSHGRRGGRRRGGRGENGAGGDTEKAVPAQRAAASGQGAQKAPAPGKEGPKGGAPKRGEQKVFAPGQNRQKPPATRQNAPGAPKPADAQERSAEERAAGNRRHHRGGRGRRRGDGPKAET